MASNIDTSTCVPLPVRSRATSAASTPHDAKMPLTTSDTESPTSVGSPSGAPVASINPHSACKMMSYAGRCDSGPVCPKPDTLA
ncbi:hypothetical protein AWB67_07001 [Caballeronia terrestris]|uniref:Uncharacterized protein n=1 Tax=Caballeronia terrestris TaxID=1226301 RepID=A0A158KWW6_9BURK|nr:hypothetical protein AWB67_07001 [Caballeronia terrestris]